MTIDLTSFFENICRQNTYLSGSIARSPMIFRQLTKNLGIHHPSAPVQKYTQVHPTVESTKERLTAKLFKSSQ